MKIYEFVDQQMAFSLHFHSQIAFSFAFAAKPRPEKSAERYGTVFFLEIQNVQRTERIYHVISR